MSMPKVPPLWLHLFFKPEVFRPILILAVRVVWVLVASVEIFDNVESAFVDIEMDVLNLLFVLCKVMCCHFISFSDARMRLKDCTVTPR